LISLVLISCAFADRYMVELAYQSKDACMANETQFIKTINAVKASACLPVLNTGFGGGVEKYFRVECTTSIAGLGLNSWSCGDDSTCTTCSINSGGIDYKGGCSDAGVSYFCEEVADFPKFIAAYDAVPKFEVRGYTTNATDCKGAPGWMRAVRADNYCDGGNTKIIFDQKKIQGCITTGCTNCDTSDDFSTLGIAIASQLTRFDIDLVDTVNECFFDSARWVTAEFTQKLPVFTSSTVATSSTATSNGTKTTATNGTAGTNGTSATTAATSASEETSTDNFASLLSASILLVISLLN